MPLPVHVHRPVTTGGRPCLSLCSGPERPHGDVTPAAAIARRVGGGPVVPQGGAEGRPPGARAQAHRGGRPPRVGRLWRPGEHPAAMAGPKAAGGRPGLRAQVPRVHRVRARALAVPAARGAARARRARLHRQLQHPRQGVPQVAWLKISHVPGISASTGTWTRSKASARGTRPTSSRRAPSATRS
ncbi:hypothetical protein FOCC_FOCC004294 [Frankliniella occidentalis]|nr:hypothetical protein FOCC_FOCC004294 [Frankliniella occidentalis]